MNNSDQSHRPSVPLLAVKLRRCLQDVFENVSLAHDVIALCVELSQNNAGDFNTEIAHVLRRCAADSLRSQLEVLTKVIGRLSGDRTGLQEEDE